VALQEYPDARRTLIEKGRQMLRKDNLLDEDRAKAQDAKHTSEEQAELVQQTMEKAQTGVARLMAEIRSVSHKLRHRLQELEKLAAKRDDAAAAAAASLVHDDVTDDVTVMMSRITSQPTNYIAPLPSATYFVYNNCRPRLLSKF